MRKKFVVLAIVAASGFLFAARSQAANPQQPQPAQAGPAPAMLPMEMAEDDACCCPRCLAMRRGSGIEGKDLNYNCGCRGSYKFPVPPQYTYHWPGIYSQRLMTDYHSPWRFPPIKPFQEDRKTQDSRPEQNAKLDRRVR